MSELTIVTRSRFEQVYDRLQGLITGPPMSVGERLQPVRTLAQRFGTSVPTVQRALALLETEGLVNRRRGSGVYVASPEPRLELDRSIALGIEVGADVFGDLATALLGHLHDRHCPVSLVDTSHAQVTALLRRMAQTKAGCFVIHGSQYALHRLAEGGIDLRGKPVVGLLDWETKHDFGPVAKVLSDYRAGAEMVVEHLWELGHRRLLICGTSTQIDDACHPDQARSVLPVAACRSWRRRGGACELFESTTADDGSAHFDAAAFRRLFEREDAPTAIFGLRDTEANLAQRLLRRHCPEVAERTAVVGYYNTPWSMSGDPAITAVDLDVAEVARLAAERIVQAQEHPRQAPPPPVLVRPKLIVRGTSVPCRGMPAAGARER